MLRLLLSPRWIAWHVLTLGAMVTCGFLAAWQWHRAGSAMGSALNVGYGLQWPLFAVFFAFLWWHFLHMEIRALRETTAADGAPGTAPDTSTGIAQAESATTATAPPAAATSSTATTESPVAESPSAGTPDAGTPDAGTPDEAEPAAPDVPAAGHGSGPSPFGPRPRGVEPSRLSDPQLRAYNDALAELAARDQET